MVAEYPASYAPRFLVTVDGTEFHEYSGVVSDVVVDTTIDGADHWSMTLTYPFDHEHGSFADLPWGTFEIGSAVEIEMGFGDGADATTKLFEGTIATIESSYPPDGPPSVTVGGYDPLKAMTDGTNSRRWERATIATVVSDVAGDYFGTVTVEKGSVKIGDVYQDKTSDYRFLRDLAEKYGYEFFATFDECFFRPKSGGTSPGKPVASLHYGETLEEFSARKTEPSIGTVEVRHWNKQTQKEIVGTAKANPNASETRVYRIPVTSKSEAETIAKALVPTPTTTCSGRTFGLPEVVAGTSVEVTGVDPTVAGTYYVRQAAHRFGASGYTLSFEGTNTSQ